MISRGKVVFLLFLAVLSATWLACDKERDPCLQPTITPVRLGMYQPADTGSLGRDTVLPSAIVGTVDTPIVWYYGAKSSKYTIVFSPLVDSTRWFIAPDSNDRVNGRDTITFYYERKLQFLSTGCGYTYYYSIKNITNTNNRIDSVKINGSEVTSDAKVEHVKIFY